MGSENVCRIQAKSKLRRGSAFSKLSLFFSPICQLDANVRVTLENHMLNMAVPWSAWVSLSHLSERDRHWSRFCCEWDVVSSRVLYDSRGHNLTNTGLTWVQLVISSTSGSVLSITQKRLRRHPSSTDRVQLAQLVRNSLRSSHWCIISCLFQKGFWRWFPLQPQAYLMNN